MPKIQLLYRVQAWLLALAACGCTTIAFAQDLQVGAIRRTSTYLQAAYSPVRWFGDPAAEKIVHGAHVSFGFVSARGFMLGMGGGVSGRFYDYFELPIEFGYASPGRQLHVVAALGPTYRRAGNVAAGMVTGLEFRFWPALADTRWRPVVALGYRWDRRDARPPDVFNRVPDLSPKGAHGVVLRLGVGR